MKRWQEGPGQADSVTQVSMRPFPHRPGQPPAGTAGTRPPTPSGQLAPGATVTCGSGPAEEIGGDQASDASAPAEPPPPLPTSAPPSLASTAVAGGRPQAAMSISPAIAGNTDRLLRPLPADVARWAILGDTAHSIPSLPLLRLTMPRFRENANRAAPPPFPQETETGWPRSPVASWGWPAAAGT